MLPFGAACEPTGADSRNREDWLAARRLTLGASEVPVLFGLSPWREDGPQSVLELWALKRGLLEPQDAGAIAQWGNRLEAPILDAYRDAVGHEVEHSTITLRSRAHPRLSATPDGIEHPAKGAPGLVQVKTTAFATEWHQRIPPYIQAQLQAELLVTGAPHVTLVWLPLVSRRLEWLTVRPVPAFHEAILERAAHFWWHVDEVRMPSPDDTASAQRTLARVLPSASEAATVLLEGSAIAAADELARIGASLKALETRKRFLTNRVVAAAGAHTRALLPDGRYFTVPQVAGGEQRCPHCEGVLFRKGPSRPCTLRPPPKRPQPEPEARAVVSLDDAVLAQDLERIAV